jgi:hypothetical protein
VSPATPAAELTLVVLAAGIGSRYGGDKQLDTIGPAGETLSDYAVQDAAVAGIRHAVFVIREELRPAFLAHHRRHAERMVIDYAVQRLDDLPPHIWCEGGTSRGARPTPCWRRSRVPGSCLVLNADDYYGPEAIRAAVRFLGHAQPGEAANVAYRLADTVSPHGPVSRAVLKTDARGWLTGIQERHDLTAALSRELPPSTVVSMNCWALGPGVVSLLAAEFGAFLGERGQSRTAESPLPESLGRLAARGVVRIRVIPEGRGWLGVTYPADREAVAAALAPH